MPQDNVQDEVITEVEVPELEPDEEDSTDWKAKTFEYQGKAKELRGIGKKWQSKYEKLAQDPRLLKPLETQTAPPAETKPEDLDYGKKAFLIANGIKADEHQLVKDELAKSKLSLEELVENEYFQAKLKRVRELRTSENATPKNTNRTGQSAADTVEYWIAKGELPPDRSLREKVVRARRDAEKNKNVFGPS